MKIIRYSTPPTGANKSPVGPALLFLLPWLSLGRPDAIGVKNRTCFAMADRPGRTSRASYHGDLCTIICPSFFIVVRSPLLGPVGRPIPASLDCNSLQSIVVSLASPIFFCFAYFLIFGSHSSVWCLGFASNKVSPERDWPVFRRASRRSSATIRATRLQTLINLRKMASTNSQTCRTFVITVILIVLQIAHTAHGKRTN